LGIEILREIRMSKIIDKNKLFGILGRISYFLKASDEASIKNIIDVHGLSSITSELALDLVRSMRDVNLVIFLAYMSKENNFATPATLKWLAVYQAISSKECKFKGLKKSTKLILNSIILERDQAFSDKKNMMELNIDSSDIELSLDFKKWTILLEIIGVMHASNAGYGEWLGFVKILAGRQAFFKSAKENEELSKIYKKIIEKLEGVDSVARSLNSIKLIYANCLQFAENYPEALKVYNSLDSKNFSAAALIDRARCSVKNGQYENAISDLDEVIASLLKEGGRSSMPDLLTTPADLNYSKKSAILAFSDIATLATFAKAELFMVSGTLLGYKRMADFLPHDKDLDFGLIGLNSLTNLIGLALNSGIFYVNPIYLKGVDTIQVPFIHIPTGIWIDVFVYHEIENDKYITGVDFQFGYRQKFEFSKFKPEKINFYNVDTYIPSNSELNLMENFSEWKISDPNYISHLESPSVVDFGGVSYQLTMRHWLIRVIQSKSIEKSKKLSKIMAACKDYPFGVSASLMDDFNLFFKNLEDRVRNESRILESATTQEEVVVINV
jgi:tetratricopeptide (TPR) repeat protein